MTEQQQADGADRGKGRTLAGVAIKSKMHKTIIVEVVRTVKHPKYNKFLKKRARYYAHDENNDVAAGDKVVIVESRPLSRLTRWRLQSIAEKAKV